MSKQVLFIQGGGEGGCPGPVSCGEPARANATWNLLHCGALCGAGRLADRRFRNTDEPA